MKVTEAEHSFAGLAEASVSTPFDFIVVSGFLASVA